MGITEALILLEVFRGEEVEEASVILNEVSDHREAVLLRHLADSAGDEWNLGIWIVQDADLCQKSFAVFGKVLWTRVWNLAYAAVSWQGGSG